METLKYFVCFKAIRYSELWCIKPRKDIVEPHTHTHLGQGQIPERDGRAAERLNSAFAACVCVCVTERRTDLQMLNRWDGPSVYWSGLERTCGVFVFVFSQISIERSQSSSTITCRARSCALRRDFSRVMTLIDAKLCDGFSLSTQIGQSGEYNYCRPSLSTKGPFVFVDNARKQFDSFLKTIWFQTSE